jgi:hypothetical protein
MCKYFNFYMLRCYTFQEKWFLGSTLDFPVIIDGKFFIKL